MKISSVRLTNFQGFADSGVLQCGAITLLVGRNNSGKSSVLNAIRLLQDGFDLPMGELVRVGAQEALVELRLEGIEPTYAQGQTIGRLELRIARGAGSPSTQFFPSSGNPSGALPVKTFPAVLPGAVLLPVLADRNMRAFDERVTEQSARAIQADINNLPGLMSNMMGRNNDRSRRFAQTCEELLGFEVGLVPTQNGQHPGLSINDETAIRLALMGAGVLRLLRLLVYLLRSENKILLIEEPERTELG